MSDDMSDGPNKSAFRWRKIEQYLKTHTFIMNSDVRRLFDVSPATANRILAQLVDKGKLIKIHERGQWKYKANIKNRNGVRPCLQRENLKNHKQYHHKRPKQERRSYSIISLQANITSHFIL